MFVFPSWRDEGRKQNGFPWFATVTKEQNLVVTPRGRCMALRTPRTELHNSARQFLQIRDRFITFSVVVNGVTC